MSNHSAGSGTPVPAHLRQRRCIGFIVFHVAQ